MAQLPSSFNSEQHDDMGSFDVIPIDEYVAMIDDSSIKPSKKAVEDANGNADLPLDSYHSLRLNFKFKVIGGEYDGRFVFAGLNIKNPNAQAVEISQKELATICRAAGKVTIGDSAELHNIPMVIKVGIKPASTQYEAQNVIKGYKPYDGTPIASNKSGAANPAKHGAAKPSAGAANGGRKPWE
jgi:hypothetical protein